MKKIDIALIFIIVSYISLTIGSIIEIFQISRNYDNLFDNKDNKKVRESLFTASLFLFTT